MDTDRVRATANSLLAQGNKNQEHRSVDHSNVFNPVALQFEAPTVHADEERLLVMSLTLHTTAMSQSITRLSHGSCSDRKA